MLLLLLLRRPRRMVHGPIKRRELPPSAPSTASAVVAPVLRRRGAQELREDVARARHVPGAGVRPGTRRTREEARGLLVPVRGVLRRARV